VLLAPKSDPLGESVNGRPIGASWTPIGAAIEDVAATEKINASYVGHLLRMTLLGRTLPDPC
jgi:hypothetical protein